MKAINGKARQPRLYADNQTLLNVYRNHLAVSAPVLCRNFGITKDKAYRIMGYVDDWCTENGIKQYYTPGSGRIVDTKLFFRAYGWDIEQIKERMSI